MHFYSMHMLAILLCYSYFALPVSSSDEYVHYKVLQKTENWEKRLYNFEGRLGIGIMKSKVVKLDEVVRRDAYKKLHDYLHGSNKERRNIPYILPVIEEVRAEYSDYTSGFACPRSITSLPQALNKEITLQKFTKAPIVYAKTLYGSPTLSEIKLAHFFLRKALERDGIVFGIYFGILRYSDNLDAEKVDVLVY